MICLLILFIKILTNIKILIRISKIYMPYLFFGEKCNILPQGENLESGIAI